MADSEIDEQFLADAGRDSSAFEAEFTSVYQEAETQSALDWAAQLDEAPATTDTFAEKTTAAGDIGRASLGAGRDVGLGVLNAPRSIARGANKAVSNIFGLYEGIHEFNTNLVLGRDPEIDIPDVPVIDGPKTDTVTGGLIEGVTQFVVGFKGVDKAVKANKLLSGGQKALEGIKGGKSFASALKGAAADLAVFDEQEQRLSNLVQDTPLANPVTEYLQAEEDDGFAEGKLKQAIEGLALGGLSEGLFEGVKLVRRGLRAKDTLGADDASKLFDEPIEEAAGIGVEAKNFEFLGNPEADDLFVRKQKKLDDAAAEVQGAFGKTKQIKQGENPQIDDYEINFAKIEGPEDIKQLMDEMVNRPELKESIDVSRRGVRDERTTLTAATDIDGFDELMSRRAGEAFNAETIVAARKVYYDTTSKLMDAAKRAASPEASDIDQFNFRKMVALHHAVQKEFMGVRAEAGRALQAWNIPVGGGGAENARALEQVLNEFGGADASKDLAKRIAARGNNLNTTQLNAITTKAATSRTIDAMSEAWTLGLLTNPTTHVVNISSNVLTAGVLGLERLAAGASRESPIALREGAEFFVGLLEAQKAGMKNAAEAFRTGRTGIGISKLDLPRTRMTSRDILDPDGKAGVFSQALDWYGAQLSKYAGGALAAGDEYSKTILYQAQVRSLAVRQGLADGLEGDALADHVARTLAEPPSSIRADAVDFANYGTFTKELGKSGQDLQRIIARNPLLRFVVPFVRTPMNIFKFTFARTPLGLLHQKAKDDIAAGGVRKAMALSRVGMGTSVMALSVDMAQNGLITGAGPTDPDTRSALRRTGWQPYSIKIGDTYHSYQRFEPLATIVGMAADMQEIMGNYEAYDIDAQREIDQLSVAVVTSIGNQVVGKTFLSGFADMIEVLSDPGRYGERYVQRYAGSLVPAGVAAVERAISPEMSQVFNMMDQVKSRIPGLSESVADRRNIWGEAIDVWTPEAESIAGRTAEGLLSLVNPIYTSREQDAPVDRWMLKNGFEINMPQKRQTFDGVRIDLRDHPQMYDRLVTLRGQEITLPKYGNQTMTQFFESLAKEEDPFGRHVGFFMEFGNSYDDQQGFINSVVRDYTNAAREALFEEFEELPALIDEGRRNEAILNNVRGPAQAQERPLP